MAVLSDFECRCRMAVLNDFEACGYGVPALQEEDLLVLNDVPARPKVQREAPCPL